MQLAGYSGEVLGSGGGGVLLTLLVFVILCLIQSCIHFVDIMFSNDKLQEPNNQENQNKNPKIAYKSFQAVFHPVGKIGNWHQNERNKQKVNACLLYNTPMLKFPYYGAY